MEFHHHGINFRRSMCTFFVGSPSQEPTGNARRISPLFSCVLSVYVPLTDAARRAKSGLSSRPNPRGDRPWIISTESYLRRGYPVGVVGTRTPFPARYPYGRRIKANQTSKLGDL